MDTEKNNLDAAPKSKRGGARPGSGRKPHPDREAINKARRDAARQARIQAKTEKSGAVNTKVAAKLASDIEAIESAGGRVYEIAECEQWISQSLRELYLSMMELAKGVTVQEIDKEGMPHVYTRPPDRDAIKYLMDRVMGKVTERAEMMPKKIGDTKESGPSPRELLHKIVLMLLAAQQQPEQPLTMPQIEEIINA